MRGVVRQHCFNEHFAFAQTKGDMRKNFDEFVNSSSRIVNQYCSVVLD